MELNPNFKLWLEVEGKTVIGEGRARLLQEIDNCGSLSKAAKNLEISYRHAHDLIGNLNERCGQNILETTIGGEKGGGTRLTVTGKQLLKDFFQLKKKIVKLIDGYAGDFSV